MQIPPCVEARCPSSSVAFLRLARRVDFLTFRSVFALGSVYVFRVTRFVVDCETLLRVAAGEIEVAAEHTLVAPTLVRSQVLSALYQAARRGEISAAEGIERVTRMNSLKVRFLGDKVLQRTAWKVADQLGWETTFDAEFLALTQLQADVFVTSDRDLARAVSGLVDTATVDALRTA